MITVSDFKNIISSKSEGYGVDSIPNFNSMLYEAMIETKLHIDLPSSIRKFLIVNPIFNSVYVNTLPNDIVLNGIINFKPYTYSVNENGDIYLNNFYTNTYSNINERIFDQINHISSTYPTLSVMHEDGKQFLNFDFKRYPNFTIFNGKSLDNLTFSNFITNTFIDYQYGLDTPGGLSMDLGLGSENNFTINLDTKDNITSNKNLTGYILSFYVPNELYNSLPSDFSITLKINYGTNQTLTITQNKNNLENSISSGNNFFIFSLPKVPTNLTNITSYNISFSMIPTPNKIIINGFFGSFGNLGEIVYYSEFQFIDGIDGSRKRIPTRDSDIILLTDEELSVFKRQFIEIFSTDLKQIGIQSDIQIYAGQPLQRIYEDFQLRHPSQRLITKEIYYGSGGVAPGGYIASSKR